MVGGHGPFVVGQPIRRCAPEGAHRPIHTGDQRRQRAVPRQRSPPGTGTTPTRRRTIGARPPRPGPDPSPTAPTSPAPGSTADTPAAPSPRVALHRGHRPAHRAPEPANPNGPSLLATRHHGRAVRRSTHSSTFARCGSINLLAAAPRPVGEAALVASRDVGLDGVMRAVSQLGRRLKRPCQVERFQNLHDLLVRLHSFPGSLEWSGRAASRAGRERQGWTPTVRSTSTRAVLLAASGQFPWPPTGSFVAAYGQDLMAADSAGCAVAAGAGGSARVEASRGELRR